jgi:hypothetical protein
MSIQGSNPNSRMSNNIRLGMSREHAIWENAKNKASRRIDVRVFNQNFGGALDALAQAVANAEYIKRFHGTLDDRTTEPVRRRAQTVRSIQLAYRRIIKDALSRLGGEQHFVGGKSKGRDIQPRPRDEVQKDIEAWNALDGELHGKDFAENMTRSVLR